MAPSRNWGFGPHTLWPDTPSLLGMRFLLAGLFLESLRSFRCPFPHSTPSLGGFRAPVTSRTRQCTCKPRQGLFYSESASIHSRLDVTCGISAHGSSSAHFTIDW